MCAPSYHLRVDGCPLYTAVTQRGDTVCFGLDYCHSLSHVEWIIYFHTELMTKYMYTYFCIVSVDNKVQICSAMQKMEPFLYECVDR